MPDDAIVVSIGADVSGLKAGVAEAKSAISGLNDAVVQQAQKFMASGLTAEETASALKNLGYSEEQVAFLTRSTAAEITTSEKGYSGLTAAIAELTDALRTQTVATLSYMDSAEAAGAANARLNDSFNGAGASTRGFVNGSAAARVELGALSGSVGAAEFGLARIAGQSKILGPLIQAAFPAFAVLAFVEILAQGVKVLEDWADQAQKTADANAAFSREMEKSIEEVNRAREQFAGLSGQAAGNAEALGHMGEKSADVSEDVKKLNERLADQPGVLRSIEETIGGAAVGAFHLFDDAAESAERSNESFNRQLADTVKHAHDLPDALAAVNTRIRELQIQLDNPSAASFSQSTEANLQRQVDLYKEWASKIQNQISAEGIEAQTLTAKTQKDIYDAEQKGLLDRVGLEEQEAEASLRINHATAEQTKAILLNLVNERVAILQEGVVRERALLSVQESAEPGVDFGAQERALAAKSLDIEIAADKERLRVRTEMDEEIKRRDQERALVSIEADQKEIEAANKVGEAYARIELEHAQTPGAVTTASIALEERLTKVYDDQIVALKQKAAVLQASDAVGNANEIRTLNAEIVALDAEKQVALLNQANETNDKLKAMDRQRVEDAMSDSRDEISEAKTATSAELADFQLLYEEKKLTAGQYVSDVKKALQEEVAAELEADQKIKTAIQELAREEVISQQQASRMIAQLAKQEANDVIQAKKKEEQETRQVALQEQKEMQKMLATVTSDLNRGVDQWIQGHKKFGQAMAEVWDSLVISVTNDILKISANFLIGLALQQSAQEKQVVMDAKTAAANAYASAPNPIIGAVEAAATFAAVVAAYTPSFEVGGIVPGAIGQAVPITAHAGEAVLPQRLTSFLNQAAESRLSGGDAQSIRSISNSTSRGNTTLHQENHFHKASDISETELTRRMMRSLKRGKLALSR